MGLMLKTTSTRHVCSKNILNIIIIGIGIRFLTSYSHVGIHDKFAKSFDCLYPVPFS